MLKNKAKLITAALEAKRHGHKGLLAQALEMLSLYFAVGKLSPSEYYDLGLYNDSTYRWDDKRRFLGWRGEGILNNTLNEPIWHALANDKLAFYGFMKGLGIPTPKLYAIYHRDHRWFGETPIFPTLDGLADFMRQHMPYPCFGKPVQGVYGNAAVLMQGFEPASDTLLLANGERPRLPDFLDRLPDPGGLGYLFQAVLTSASEMRAVCGERLSSVRMWTNLTHQGVRLSAAEWKIPTGRNMVDNYHDGSSGNLIAEVDMESGKVLKVFGRGDQLVEYHPDTGTRLTDVELPDWGAVKDLALRASRAFPKLRFQGWDIAFSAHGPVPLEVNLASYGALYDMQLKTKRGILDDELLACVPQRRNKGRLERRFS